MRTKRRETSVLPGRPGEALWKEGNFEWSLGEWVGVFQRQRSIQISETRFPKRGRGVGGGGEPWHESPRRGRAPERWLCSHGCVHATRPFLLSGWRQSDCCCCPGRCFSSHPTSPAPLNGKPNLWNKWDCGRSVKWSSNHDQCGSIHPQGGEIPPACQTAGLTVHPYSKANRGSLWRRSQSPRKMLWLFWVNISMALRGKYVVNFEICLDFRYFVSDHITVPKEGSNFSFPSNL